MSAPSDLLAARALLQREQRVEILSRCRVSRIQLERFAKLLFRSHAITRIRRNRAK
jgi:hypothetical protein